MRNFLIFGRSPFGAFQGQMDRVAETLQHLRPFFEAFLRADAERVRELRKKIMKLEHEADLAKNDIREHLPKSYFMPVDRRDLLGLLHQQDKLADLCEDVVIVATLRPTLPLPEDLHDRMLALVDRTLQTCDLARELIGRFDTLVESSFGGPQAEDVIELINRISQEEHEVDKAAYTLSQEMYRREEAIGPVALMLWQKLIELLGQLANASEAIGDHLRLMVHR